jgi:hypothetical protein
MTHHWFTFILYALAAYRAARLIVIDDIMAPMREWFRTRGFVTQKRMNGMVEETRLQVVNRVWAFLFRLTNCMWCATIWTGAIIVALGYYQGDWFQYVAAVLGLSTVSGVIHEKTHNGG